MKKDSNRTLFLIILRLYIPPLMPYLLYEVFFDLLSMVPQQAAL